LLVSLVLCIVGRIDQRVHQCTEVAEIRHSGRGVSQ
jgi:hypothetical protein